MALFVPNSFFVGEPVPPRPPPKAIDPMPLGTIAFGRMGGKLGAWVFTSFLGDHGLRVFSF